MTADEENAQRSGGRLPGAQYRRRFCQAGIAEASIILAGKKWQVVKVDLQPAQRKGKGPQVLGPPLVALRGESGREKSVRLVGGLLERDGVYKVSTLYVNPSLRASR